jgi:hypothetical protein
MSELSGETKADMARDCGGKTTLRDSDASRSAILWRDGMIAIIIPPPFDLSLSIPNINHSTHHDVVAIASPQT